VGADDLRGFIPLDELTRPASPEAGAGTCCSSDVAEESGACCSATPTAAAPVVQVAPVSAAVKARYDRMAGQGTSTLCCSPRTVYSEEELAGVPPWVLELSSGCGSPLDAVTLTPGQTVVDFGCGAGLDLLIAARRVGPDGRVIGIDGSVNMVRTARRAAAEAGLSNIDVRVGDIRRPPLRAGTVDVLLSNCVLGMFPDKQEVLSAIATALRPGGMAVISDVVYADGTPPPGVTTTASATAEDFARCVVGMTETAYRDMILESGFDKVDLRTDGLVPYRDGTEVTSAMIFAYRGAAAPSGQPCC
jgi:arsenite methyltransferase